MIVDIIIAPILFGRAISVINKFFVKPAFGGFSGFMENTSLLEKEASIEEMKSQWSQ